MRYLNVSLLSLCVATESPPAFLAGMRRMMSGMHSLPDVFVLEGGSAWTSSLCPEEICLRSEEIRDAVCLLSDEFGFHAVVGNLPWQTDRGLGNRTWITNDFGRIFAFYDQVHVRSFEGQPPASVGGDRPVFFDIDGVSCSVVTGYDIYFPEYMRTLSLAGAKVVFALTAPPIYERTAQESILRALAIGNQVFLVACGKVDPAGREACAEAASAFSPSGDEAVLFEEEGRARSVSLDITEVDRCRKSLPLERDRKPGLYLLLTE